MLVPVTYAYSVSRKCSSAATPMSVIQDDGHIPGALEKQIFETLAKIRKRDRSIYDSSQHFFAEANEQAEEAPAEHETKAKKAKKPMYLKDVIAQQVGQLYKCA